MKSSFGKPLGYGSLGSLLSQELKIGERASVLDTEHIHKDGTEVDATLYQKDTNGRIYRVNDLNKVHLDPNTLEEKK